MVKTLKEMIADVESALNRRNQQLIHVGLRITKCVRNGANNTELQLLIEKENGIVTTKEALKNHLEDLKELLNECRK